MVSSHPDTTSGSQCDADLGAGSLRSFFKLSALRKLLSASMASWGISGVLHFSLIAIISVTAWDLIDFSEPELKPSIAASLGDTEVLDDAAALEITAAVSGSVSEDQVGSREMAGFFKAMETGWVKTAPSNPDAAAFSELNSDESGGGTEGFYFREPASGLAVTRGSFTAWTEPRSPAPGESYLIVIEIRLPEDLRKYRISDLSGVVQGTDDYRQKIPWDPRAPRASAASVDSKLKVLGHSEVIPVVRQKVQLVVRVPGASRKVRDVIRIRSKRLREDQEITLVFGGEGSQSEFSAQK
jgi:hypothetical protein